MAKITKRGRTVVVKETETGITVTSPEGDTIEGKRLPPGNDLVIDGVAFPQLLTDEVQSAVHLYFANKYGIG